MNRATAAVVAIAGCSALTLVAQAVTVVPAGSGIAVRAPGFTFVKGEPLRQLKDGRSVRVHLELDVLLGPRQPPAAQARQTFVLSYDLWEERFAVTLEGSAPRSIAYLTSSAAEAWCLEQLTVPMSALGRVGRELPFWIRLGYRVPDAEAAVANDESGFTLRGMVDALSRRRRNDPLAHSIEAGPFRLPL